MSSNRRIWRLRLGSQGIEAEYAFSDGSAGVGFDIPEDLSGKFPEEWREFNENYIPGWLERNPEKSKVAAGLSCAAVWTLGRGIRQGDLLMTPTPDGRFRFGKVTGEYYFDAENVLPHRRRVEWLDEFAEKEDLSEGLYRSIRGPLSLVQITKYSDEIEALVEGVPAPSITSSDPDIEDPSVFALEQHLEDFLIANWSQTSLAEGYDLLEDGGEMVAQQFPTDTGPIDILAVSKDRSEFLVIELKRGRASDVVVGQIQRYMGYVLSELTVDGQSVKGAIIALNEDKRLERALTVAPNIDFYRYRVNFELEKG